MKEEIKINPELTSTVYMGGDEQQQKDWSEQKDSLSDLTEEQLIELSILLGEIPLE